MSYQIKASIFSIASTTTLNPAINLQHHYFHLHRDCTAFSDGMTCGSFKSATSLFFNDNASIKSE